MSAEHQSEESVSHFKTENGWRPDVYQILIEHMRTADWDPAPLMGWLYDWSRLFIVEFEMRIPVPPGPAPTKVLPR